MRAQLAASEDENGPLTLPADSRFIDPHTHMIARGLSAAAIRQVTCENALAVYGLNGEMREADCADPAPIDQRTLFSGNSLIRGGQAPRTTHPGRAPDLLEIV